MRPQTPIPRWQRKKLKKLLQSTKTKADFRRVQCVWLRAEFGMDAMTIAAITHLKSGTVRKIWSNFLREGETSLIGKNRGGRRNSYLTLQEEEEFLLPYLQGKTPDNVAMAAEIKKAYETRIGKEVPKSTIYRLLARHGWSKRQAESTEAEATSFHSDEDTNE